MPSLRFFAAKDDQLAILDFLFRDLGCRILESYSEPDSELREFFSVAELSASLDLGRDKHGNGLAASLIVHDPVSCGPLKIERIALNPKACGGATYRYCAQSNGCINLHLGGVHDRFLTQSYLGRNSESRAQAWEVGGGVDWQDADRVWRKLAYHIGNRLAVGKLPGVAILPQALELARAGMVLTQSARASCNYQFKDIKPVKRPRTNRGKGSQRP